MLAAFANADGGTLVLGVEDDGTPSGHGYPAETVADRLAMPERRLRPPVRCRSQHVTLDGNEALIVQLPIAPEAVMMEANGFHRRPVLSSRGFGCSRARVSMGVHRALRSE